MEDIRMEEKSLSWILIEDLHQLRDMNPIQHSQYFCEDY